MPIHARILTDTLEDTGVRKDIEGAPPDLSHKTPPLKWVPVTARGPRPAFDPATHHAPQRATDIITVNDLTEGWAAAVALTAQEITDRDTAVYDALTAEVDATLVEQGAEAVKVRALIENANQRANYLTNRVIQLENALAALLESTGNNWSQARSSGQAAAAVAFPQTQSAEAVIHFAAIATRDRPTAVQAYKDDITSGSVNT